MGSGDGRGQQGGSRSPGRWAEQSHGSCPAGGHLEVCLAPDDLDSRSQVLSALAAGRSAAWMDDGRNAEIRFESSGQDGVAEVVVEDVADRGHRSASRYV
ncbi:DUF5959 family protein [Streptomyces sp. NPDC058620]|uniref:DUF5959 family protein n=1 Tax=Streptomyces sp. NPDC058620 TaxID=3346560 RepID=UPI0036536579